MSIIPLGGRPRRVPVVVGGAVAGAGAGAGAAGWATEIQLLNETAEHARKIQLTL